MQIQTEVTMRILKECFGVSELDKILIISDSGENSSRLASLYAKSAENRNNTSHHILQEPQTELSPAGDALTKILTAFPDKNIVILAVSNKLGSLGALGKSFRHFCQQRQHRFISTTGLSSLNDFPAIMDAMDVDYMNMHMHGLWLKRQIDNASSMRITTDAGTDVTIDIFGMQAISNTGNYRQPGTGGNIPAGEVYIAPRGTTNVNGTVVIDGSMRTDECGILVSEPVNICIKNGRAVRIEGKKAYLLEEALKRAEQHAKYPERVRVIGEIGIGINPKARLVGTTIIDEKAMGTAHIALGSNYWFGGANRTVFHADQVFKNPQIFLDGRQIDTHPPQ
ncbi:aminopeptidase [Candidatus Woesearchaeota archaeon]|nr:aminopeptidase [Candidatus Woesearchaeota archaeon]